MAETGDYATKPAIMDCPVIGEKLPPTRTAVLEELDAAISGLQVALDYCRGNAAQRQRVAQALGRLRIAATLRPEIREALQPAIEQLDAALECIGWVGCDTVREAQEGALEVRQRLREEEA